MSRGLIIKIYRMKKNYIVLACLFFIFFKGYSQDRSPHVDRYLLQEVQKNKLAATDIASYKILSSHTSSLSGVEHIYYRQSYNNIEIVGTESSIHIKNGELIQAHDTFLKEVQNNILISNFGINEVSAIQSIASQMGYTQNGVISQLSYNANGNQVRVFSKAGISLEDIPVKRVYKLLPNGKLVASWELSIREVAGSNWFNFYANATTGQIIEKVNWMLSCNTHDHDHTTEDHFTEKNTTSTNKNMPVSYPNATVANEGTYNVFAIPVESPLHGDRSIVTDPHNLIASPYGWHDVNGSPGAEFTVTEGNNVNAYEDGDNFGHQPDGGSDLIFDFPFDPVYTPANQSEDAAITNLFYWSNVTHDILYLYGLDEASGNFQVNNYGNGGLGNDSVNAEAQDGAGTCNANFGTPPDGSSPTMQMFICGNRDGDFDNQVIIHEYGHGISNRLTGGASNSGCLFNDEQMGEGWSDWYGTVMTIEEGDVGTDSRPVGNYLFQQDANGPGIRDFPYSTDLSVDPRTYDFIQGTSGPHPLGSTWAAMLWEVTWSLIDEYGFDADLYNGTGGNNIAIALVTEGLKLQPCNPGFVDGRDAILAADIALYDGANQCLIWDAFAKRGLGVSADQGSSFSRTDGTEAFDTPTTSLDIVEEELCITEEDVTLGGGFPIGGAYSGTGVTDNGDGETFTFSPSEAGVGEHIISYTAESDCDGGDTATDILTVIESELNIECPEDMTVSVDFGDTTYSLEDFTTEASTGVCSFTITQDPPVGTILNVGDTIDVTLTATDDNDASVDCTFSLTVDSCNALEVGSFIGSYGMEQLTPSIFGYDTFIDAINSPLELFEGETDASQVDPFIPLDTNQRSFDADYIAILGFDNTETYIIEFDGCDDGVTFSDLEDTALQCGDGIQLGPDEGGTFDVNDDSEFTFAFQDDITDDCGTGSPNVLIRFFQTVPLEIECMDAEISLGEDGIAFIDVSDVLVGSTDGASVDISTFNCSNLGENTVTVTVEQNGQTAVCQAIVTVTDPIFPVIECPDSLTVNADPGETTYTFENFASLASDNCGFAFTQSPAPGTLANIGDVITVTLTATDDSGNAVECSFDLTVTDSCDIIPELGTFTGDYFMEQLTPSIFGYDTFIDGVNSPLTLFEIETDASQIDPFLPLAINERSFDAAYLAILGFNNLDTYIIVFDGCDDEGSNVTYVSGDSGLQCANGIFFGPAIGGSFDVDDDSEFVFAFQDDITDDCGTGSPDVLIRFSREPLSTNNVQFDNEIAVYPNPTSDIFSIRNRGGFPLTQALVTDVNGRVLQTVDLSSASLETQISLSDYADGLYFVQIQSNNASIVKRIIKN